jgi:hypothetical protein
MPLSAPDTRAGIKRRRLTREHDAQMAPRRTDARRRPSRRSATGVGLTTMASRSCASIWSREARDRGSRSDRLSRRYGQAV